MAFQNRIQAFFHKTFLSTLNGTVTNFQDLSDLFICCFIGILSLIAIQQNAGYFKALGRMEAFLDDGLKFAYFFPPLNGSCIVA